jgi:hypothetical protein
LNSQQAQELLTRNDLDNGAKEILNKFIKGQNTQQPPAANKSADEKARRQDEIKKELKDIDEQFKEISDLITLASGKEGPDKCYNDNKNIFDDYAERKKIDKNIVEILKKLVNDEYGLEERQKNLKDEAEKLNKQ